MARVSVELFAEDHGHELFARAMITKLARAAGIGVQLVSRSTSGGKGKAIQEFRAYQTARQKGLLPQQAPDILIIMIDGNAVGARETVRAIEGAVDRAVFPRVVAASPDPHVEAWCFADSDAFRKTIGCEVPAYARKKVTPKEALRSAIIDSGGVIATDAMEYAPDLIAEMDLYRAGKSDPSLHHFVDGLRTALKAFVKAPDPEK